MSYPSSEVLYCHRCGAPNPATDSKCWICHRELSAPESGAGAPPVHPPQFALSTLLLVVTLVCVCLGVATISPGLLIPLLFIVVPALLRTISEPQRAPSRHGPPTIIDRLSTFALSFGIVALIWWAGAIAFWAACAAAIGVGMSLPEAAGIPLAIAISIVGILGALMLVVFLFKKTWPRG